MKNLLEKFSPEEIAQIKRELGMKADVWMTKEKAAKDSGIKEIWEKLFPVKIKGIYNSYGLKEDMTKLYFRLADALMGNCVVRTSSSRYGKSPLIVSPTSVRESQFAEYTELLIRLADSLAFLWNEYRPIREKNLQMALDEWNAKKTEGGDEE